jgi:hypothetical protein
MNTVQETTKTPNIFRVSLHNTCILVIKEQQQLKVNDENDKAIDIFSQYYISRTENECSVFPEMFLPPTILQYLLVQEIKILFFRTVKVSSSICRSFFYLLSIFSG